MPTVHDSFLGVAEETVYGTAVAVTRFFEFKSESISSKWEVIEAEGIRGGARALHKDRFIPNPKGAEGDAEFEVLDKSFGLLLKHALGAVATTGAGPYVHTFTVGALQGKSLTCQVGRVDNTGTTIPFTYAGGKVAKLELSNEVDGILSLKPTFDFAQETAGAGAGAFALATATYPASAQLFSFLGGTATIAGTAFDISEAGVTIDNGLKTDRYFLRGATSGIKKEPLEEKLRKIDFNLTGEFSGLTHYQRVTSLTAAGSLAAVQLKWVTPQGGVLQVDIPNGRFDEGPINASLEITSIALKGMALAGDSGSPITITYTTPDTTP